MGFAHRILRVIEDNALPANSVVHAYIRHDRACTVVQGEPCLCDPQIRIAHKDRVFEVDLEGTLLEVS